MKLGWVLAGVLAAVGVGAVGVRKVEARVYSSQVEQALAPWASEFVNRANPGCTVGLEPRSFEDEMRAEQESLVEAMPKLRAIVPPERLVAEHRELLRAVDAYLVTPPEAPPDPRLLEALNRVSRAIRASGATFTQVEKDTWIVDWL